MKYWFLNMMDRLFSQRVFQIPPTKETIVPEKKVTTPYTRQLRKLQNTPVVYPSKNTVKPVEQTTYNRPTVPDESLDLLAGAVLAHSLRFEPEPERFTSNGGTFGGAEASGGWEDKSEDFTSSDNDTSI